MTNSFLNLLEQKDMITIKGVNKRNVDNIVSPTGIEEIGWRSYQYRQRTLMNVVDCRHAIEDLNGEVKKVRYSKIRLTVRTIWISLLSIHVDI
jgi:hypothetical protein